MSESKTTMEYQVLLQYPLTWMVIGVMVMSIVMYFAQGLIVLFGGVVLGLYLYQNFAPEQSKKQQHEIIQKVSDHLHPNLIQNVWGKISEKLGEGFQNQRKPEKRSGWRWWHTP